MKQAFYLAISFIAFLIIPTPIDLIVNPFIELLSPGPVKTLIYLIPALTEATIAVALINWIESFLGNFKL